MSKRRETALRSRDHWTESIGVQTLPGAIDSAEVPGYAGVTGDFSGVYSSGQSLHTYTFGPVISRPKSGFSPFAHALFGGARTAAGGFSDSGFAMMFGGGLDFGKRKLVLRAVQLDWMTLRFN